MIDPILLGIFAVVAWLVAGEGAWGAATTFFSVVFSGLIAMMLFEPLANWLAANVLTGTVWNSRVDVISLLAVFAVSVTALRLAGEQIQKTDLDMEGKSYDILRWLCGLGTGYVTMAIVLTSLHTAPLPREFAGFTPERENLFGVAPDRQWLAFTQRASEWTFSTRAGGQKVVFDGPEYALLAGQPAQRWASFPIRYASRRARAQGLVGGPTGSGGGPPGSTPAAGGEEGGSPQSMGGI